ncbi:MAG TPA: hypothetical protein VHD62_15390 [Opitutaceae bacterium]|nr:hypothetical protein [Opitutaceae bacterium]
MQLASSPNARANPALLKLAVSLAEATVLHPDRHQPADALLPQAFALVGAIVQQVSAKIPSAPEAAPGSARSSVKPAAPAEPEVVAKPGEIIDFGKPAEPAKEAVRAVASEPAPKKQSSEDTRPLIITDQEVQEAKDDLERTLGITPEASAPGAKTDATEKVETATTVPASVAPGPGAAPAPPSSAPPAVKEEKKSPPLQKPDGLKQQKPHPVDALGVRG